MVLLLIMTILEVTKNTHDRLLKIKNKMKSKNLKIYKINNDLVINHALKIVEEFDKYEITNID